MPVKSAILYGSCDTLLRQLPEECASLVCTDPPFNIGRKYAVHNDNMQRQDYLNWMSGWMASCYRILQSNGSIYICQGDEYAAETKISAEATGFCLRSWIIWYYTFGENQSKKFNRCHTHIFYFVKDPKNFIFHPEKVPSARQVKYNDKRAISGGKCPDDVWTDSRVCGTFKERLFRSNGKSFNNQMPESIMRRIILTSSNSGELVIDPFCGTGTTAAVAAQYGRRYWTCDIDLECVQCGINRVKRICK